MALKIRLRRMGRKKAPHYRIVIAESSMPRDGRFVATIGHYNPTTQPETLKVDLAKAEAWMAKGAVPTDTVRSLLRRAPAAPEGVVETVKSAASTAGRAVKGAAGKAADAAKDVAGRAADVAQDVAGKAADVAQDAASTVADAAKGAALAVADAAGSVFDKVKDAAESVVERVTGGDDAAAAEAETAADEAPEGATADAFPTAVNSQVTDAVTETEEPPVADAPGAEAATADAPLAATPVADDAAPAEGEEPAQS